MLQEAVLSKGLATVSLKPKLLLNDAVRRARDVERLAATSSTPQDDKAILVRKLLQQMGFLAATFGWLMMYACIAFAYVSNSTLESNDWALTRQLTSNCSCFPACA